MRFEFDAACHRLQYFWFAGFPPHLCSTGIAQQMWLYRMNDYHPIYVVDTMEQSAEYDAVLIGWDELRQEFVILS
ncbi:MAG: hypothetical protein US69_C0001G0013 [candidate division TM6 bacterium GW2011_GWF2_38_10]|nr:MAG: hypothetical protein US69_C0001G0013 [candidate division TM6 bacterium GW2011_GWF2_38_10]